MVSACLHRVFCFTARDDRVSDLEAGIPKLFAALAAAAPQRTQYLATRLVDSPEFTLLLHLADGEPNPLPQIAEAAAFRRALPGWSLAAPEPQEMTVLGNYRMLD